MTSKRQIRRLRGKRRVEVEREKSPHDIWRRSFSTIDLTEDQVRAIGAARMDPRHNHLNALLDDDFGRRLIAPKGTVAPDVDLEI